jgi:hypothetical protein
MNSGIRLLCVLCVLSCGETARAQEPAAQPNLELGSTLTPAMLRDLPVGSNIFAAIETTQGEVTSDRFYGGGLNTGRSAHMGAFLNSFTQTQFRIGDVNVTAPDGRGTPFLTPALSFWERVNVSTAFMPADFNAPGLGVTFEPRRPGVTWTRMFEASAASPGFVATPAAGSPASIEHLRQWQHGGLLLSGPLTSRLGLVVAGDWSKASQFERASATAVDGESATGLINLVYTPGPRTELRTVGWAGRTRTPQDEQTSFHVQTTWERHEPRDLSWRIFAAYSQRTNSTNAVPGAATATIDRITDGPVPLFIDTGNRTDRRWSFGVRSTKLRRAHALQVGFDAGGTGSRVAPGFSGAIGELVDGIRARMWNYTAAGVDARRHSASISAFVTDRVSLGRRVTMEAGFAYDGVTGSATGGATEVAWETVLPRVSLRWSVTDFKAIAVFAGYRRSADQLTLDLVSVGDPAGATASVSRWNAQGVGPVVMRVGPGTGGDPTFTAIDPLLLRPTTDEIVAGIEARPFGTVRARIAGIMKRQQHLVDLVDLGTPLSSYQVQGVVDGRPAGDGGDVVLPVYNRLPSAFGADRYLLTNPDQESPTFSGLVFSADASTRRLAFLLTATASQAFVAGANRGYHVAENDAASAVGELFVDPNAATNARGRPFFDRAYTLKLTTAYHFPADVTLGVIARYQDGQPFSRMTIVNGLNQGAEFVRALRAGESRFTYTGTLDVRLQKGFVAGPGRRVRLDLLVDAYNMINLGNEVEERIVTGPGFRDITAIQPPRTVHAGLRLSF